MIKKYIICQILIIKISKLFNLNNSKEDNKKKNT